MVEGEGQGRRPGVSVVDRDVPAGRWQRVDLAAIRGLPAAPPLAAGRPTMRLTSVLSFPERTRQLAAAVPPRRAGRLPPAVFVSVGPVAATRQGARGGYEKRGPAASANDNLRRGLPARAVWRDLFFLAILFGTVAGAFWSGRLHALQRVIVVPAPAGFSTVIT